MPNLKNRMIFISHAWQHNEHYWKIVEWLNEAQNFSWSNCRKDRGTPMKICVA